MTDSLTATSEVTADTLAAFSDAFNRHDAAALMDFMTEDCVFDTAGGNDIHGTRFTGRAAVQAAFEAVFKTFPDAHWGHGRHYVAGERGVSEWVFTGTHAEGWRIEAEGCDLFEFRDGLIAVKRCFARNAQSKLPDCFDRRQWAHQIGRWQACGSHRSGTVPASSTGCLERT